MLEHGKLNSKCGFKHEVQTVLAASWYTSELTLFHEVSRNSLPLASTFGTLERTGNSRPGLPLHIMNVRCVSTTRGAEHAMPAPVSFPNPDKTAGSSCQIAISTVIVKPRPGIGDSTAENQSIVKCGAGR